LAAIDSLLGEIREDSLAAGYVFYGEEDYLAKLSPALQRHAEHLTFMDLLSAEEMPSFYSLCDVIALTSLNSTESFGMVALEAMACGTPVVATDVGDLGHIIIQGKTGYVVNNMPQKLADGIYRLISGRTLDPADVRASVKRYSWMKIAGAIAREFQRTVATAPAYV
jgi:D-inositol-3-phosphate glycosyltransferase